VSQTDDNLVQSIHARRIRPLECRRKGQCALRRKIGKRSEHFGQLMIDLTIILPPSRHVELEQRITGMHQGVLTLLYANAERPDTPKLPGDVVAAHHAHHLATDLLLDHRPPGDQAEAQPIVDHGETAAGKLC
jgi:hypothetical protein